MLCGVVYTLMSANTSLSLAASTPFTLTIFGASGHLAGQKLYPALYTLALKKRLPAQYAIVGYARIRFGVALFTHPLKQSKVLLTGGILLYAVHGRTTNPWIAFALFEGCALVCFAQEIRAMIDSARGRSPSSAKG
jgi:hypothetical protein